MEKKGKRSQLLLSDSPIFNTKMDKYKANSLRKKINKKKNETHKKVGFNIKLLDIKQFGIKVFGDLMITHSGQIKLCSALIHVSFGQQKSQSIEYIKDTNCYQIKLAPYSHIPISTAYTAQEALQLIDRYPQCINLKELFIDIEQRISKIKSKIKKYLFQQQQEEQEKKDQEFDYFSSSCLQYLKIYIENNNDLKNEEETIASIFKNMQLYQIISNQERCYHLQGKEKKLEGQLLIPSKLSSFHFGRKIINHQQISKICSYCSDQFKSITYQGMFTYVIGRLNWEQNDIETTYYGYSKGYLDLLGLDEQSLINLQLRDKQIDLVRNNSDITTYSVLQLNSRIYGIPLDENVLNIFTFDGFPIKIYQKQKKIIFNRFLNELIPEFVLSMTEIDVDLNDLQNLMNYRSQLNTLQNSLPIEILIQRELSYKFEDVEYSVRSENFIDKYYKDNFVALKAIKDNKIVQKQKQRCKFRQSQQSDYFKQIEVFSG